MTSNDWFKINGVSSDTVGIYVDTPSVPPMARQRYTTWQSGSDEDGTTPDDTYEDVDYSLTFYTFDTDNFDNTAIYAFLANPRTLEISRFEGYYFKVRQFSMDEIECVADGKKIRYTVTFKLAPFKYKTSNPEINVGKGGVVTNNGTRYSKPIIKLTVAGDTALIVNGVYFDIYGMNGETITLDSTRMIAHIDGVIANLKTVGQFPFLAVGDNYIDWTGDVSSCKITVNARCY